MHQQQAAAGRGAPCWADEHGGGSAYRNKCDWLDRHATAAAAVAEGAAASLLLSATLVLSSLRVPKVDRDTLHGRKPIDEHHGAGGGTAGVAASVAVATVATKALAAAVASNCG